MPSELMFCFNLIESHQWLLIESHQWLLRHLCMVNSFFILCYASV